MQSTVSVLTIPPIFVWFIGSFVISVGPRRLMTHASRPVIDWSVQVFEASPLPTPGSKRRQGWGKAGGVV